MIYQTNKSGSRIVMELTTAGIAVASVFRVLVSLPILIIGLGLFFGIEFIGRSQAGVAIADNFWLGVGATAVFGSLSIGLIGLLRRERWFVDTAADIVGFERRIIGSDWSGETVDLSDLKHIILTVRPKLRLTEIEGDFNGNVETFCSTRLGRQAVSSCEEALTKLSEKHGITFEVRE